MSYHGCQWMDYICSCLPYANWHTLSLDIHNNRHQSKNYLKTLSTSQSLCQGNPFELTLTKTYHNIHISWVVSHVIIYRNSLSLTCILRLSKPNMYLMGFLCPSSWPNHLKLMFPIIHILSHLENMFSKLILLRP